MAQTEIKVLPPVIFTRYGLVTAGLLALAGHFSWRRPLGVPGGATDKSVAPVTRPAGRKEIRTGPGTGAR